MSGRWTARVPCHITRGVTSATVAIQGERGSYSHMAAMDAFGRDVTIVPCREFDDVFDAVTTGSVPHGLVPIENTVTGAIYGNYERLASEDLHITGEAVIHVRQCLVGRTDTRLADVRRILSHPVALAQCQRFLSAHPEIQAIAWHDTAGAVADIMAGRVEAQAAIAGAFAAECHGAAILAEGIEDTPGNWSRFAVIAREPVVPASGPLKMSLLFGLPNQPGVAHAVLGILAARGLNLTKIESQAVVGRPWESRFYLDVTGSDAGSLKDALAELVQRVQSVRLLGMYRPARGPG